MSIVSCIYQHCQMVIFLCKLAEEQQFIYLTVVNIYKISGQKLKTYLKIISLSLISYKRDSFMISNKFLMMGIL